MRTHEALEQRLLIAYSEISEKNSPDWAVHKRNSDELVKPTIPFVGKHYLEQPKKILVYASAENLSDYWKGNDKHWPGDWLDNDKKAQNRHRMCFEDETMQRKDRLPYVHCGPLEDGGLLIAAMYIAIVAKLRSSTINPREFYESIAFGNYGKYSIETELQRIIKENPQLTIDEKKTLKNQLKGKGNNIDYASNSDYLVASHDFIRADIAYLKPDYIIMPNVQDNGFIDDLTGCYGTKIIRINQMNGPVVNNMAPNKRNNYRSKYNRRDPECLPEIIREARNLMRRISKENYLYVFDHLDMRIHAALKEDC